MSASQLPLHTPIASEMSGITVEHLYGMQTRPHRDAVVKFQDGKITVVKKACGTSYEDSEQTDTFCSTNCVEIHHPFTNDMFSVNIRHHCVDGWRMRFRCDDAAHLQKFKDWFLRAKNDTLFSHNLLLPDHLQTLGIPSTLKWTAAQCQAVRDETTPALPKGTAAQKKTMKALMKADLPVGVSIVNNCPTGRHWTTGKYTVDEILVSEGKMGIFYPRGQVLQVDSAEFRPPRLVTPASSPVCIYVCDQRNPTNQAVHFQAWAFEVSKANAARFLETFLHAWMETGNNAKPTNVKSPKNQKKEKTSIVKKIGPAKSKVVKKAAKAKATPVKKAAKAKTAVQKKTTTPKKATAAKKTVAKSTPASAKKETVKKVTKGTATPKKAAPKKKAVTKPPPKKATSATAALTNVATLKKKAVTKSPAKKAATKKIVTPKKTAVTKSPPKKATKAAATSKKAPKKKAAAKPATPAKKATKKAAKTRKIYAVIGCGPGAKYVYEGTKQAEAMKKRMSDKTQANGGAKNSRAAKAK